MVSKRNKNCKRTSKNSCFKKCCIRPHRIIPNKLGYYSTLDFLSDKIYNVPNRYHCDPNLPYLAKQHFRMYSSRNLCPGLCPRCIKHNRHYAV